MPSKTPKATPKETPKTILITGATGKQGGAVLQELTSQEGDTQDFTLLAVTRNASSASAQKLAARYPNAHLVQGDLNDVPALFAAAKKTLKDAGKDDHIWGVYSVQISMGPGVSEASEIKQGSDLIDESIKQGVKHFVYSSVERGGNEKSFTTKTPIPHFQTKYHIEQHLLEKAGKDGQVMGWTILRPVAFMENLVPGMPTKVFLAALRDTLKDKSLQWVSVEDIGLFAAEAFRDPKGWNARAEGLAGDELTFDQLSTCFEKATGYPAPATYGVLGSALMWAVTEVKVMVTWFATDGYGVDVQKLRMEQPALYGFEDWLRERSGFVSR